MLPTIEPRIRHQQRKLTNQARGVAIFPRQFAQASWPSASGMNETQCTKTVEEFVDRTESNRLYIEQSLQPVYAADFFFLFSRWRGRQRDDYSSMRSSTTGRPAGTTCINISSRMALEFVHNTQLIDVRLYCLIANVISTPASSELLFLIAIAVALFGKQHEARL